MKSSLQISDSLHFTVADSIRKAASCLLAQQSAEGYWCPDLKADTTLESDYVMLQLWLHPPVDGIWNPPTRRLIDKAVGAILARQLEDGGFNIYLKGPSEVSASIKAYFALKLAGVPATDSRMERLRGRILEMGGLQAANSYVRTNLSLFGLYPREACPSIPPELILLPFNFIYQMSSWTRAIVIALSIVHSADPQRPVPDSFNLDELYLPGAPAMPQRDSRLFSWRNCFLAVDHLLKLWETRGPGFIRRYAVRRCAAWMIERFENSDGLGAIYPSMQYSIMALDVLGYATDHPLRIEAEKQFNALIIDRDREFFIQPCFSPVWDSAIAAFALAETENPPYAALRRSADWFLSKEVRRNGDWRRKRPRAAPSGWAFEFNNEFYPDVDDTAMVLLAFANARASNEVEQRACEKRAVDWLLAMQGNDGGWAAFDVDNNWSVLSHVPFADHNAMLDPSCSDITGRVVEALIRCGLKPSHPALRRGVEFLLRAQESDGSWYGRWGVNYIYGTFLALRGLRSAGLSEHEPAIQQALEFIRAYQNYDGGWGESCASYDENHFVPNPSTPSQTAWAILALLAGGDVRSESLYNGIEYLTRLQRADGTWDEEYCTGTGFPKVFYLSYTGYRNAFPLLALATFMNMTAPQKRELAQSVAAAQSR